MTVSQVAATVGLTPKTVRQHIRGAGCARCACTSAAAALLVARCEVRRQY